MTFTPLEAILLTFVTSLLVGIVVRAIAGRDHVTCKDCELHRQAFDDELAAVRAEHEAAVKKDKEDHAMMLRMLRSIVVRLEIPSDKKEAILNDNGGSK